MTPETVRVRIAVALRQDGTYTAYGSDRIMPYHSYTEWATDAGGVLVWVEADLPIPQTVTVEGTVSQ